MKTIRIKRMTKANEKNLNGYTYDEETVTPALDSAIKDRTPVCLGPLNNEVYKSYCTDLSIFPYVIGFITDYDDETITVFVNSNIDIVDDYIIPNIDKISILMSYMGNVDHTNKIIHDMQIKRFDICCLPETYFD